MKQKWFKQMGWLYFPVHPMGWLVTVLAVLFLVPVAKAVDHHSHSVTDFLYTFFLYATAVAFWWKWVAEKTS